MHIQYERTLARVARVASPLVVVVHHLWRMGCIPPYHCYELIGYYYYYYYYYYYLL